MSNEQRHLPIARARHTVEPLHWGRHLTNEPSWTIRVCRVGLVATASTTVAVGRVLKGG